MNDDIAVFYRSSNNSVRAEISNRGKNIYATINKITYMLKV